MYVYRNVCNVLLSVGYKTATLVNFTLPSKSDVTLRWRQASHSGSTFDEWALDDIDITGEGVNAPSTTYYIINEDFGPPTSIP